MNPLEIINFYEKKMINGLSNVTDPIPVEQVKDLVKQAYENARTAVVEGEFVYDIETQLANNIVVGDIDFTMRKLVNNSGDQVLILQIVPKEDTDVTQLEIDAIEKGIAEAVKTSDTINGVLLLPPEVDINLVIARMDIEKYVVNDMSPEDSKLLQKFLDKNTNVTPDVDSDVVTEFGTPNWEEGYSDPSSLFMDNLLNLSGDLKKGLTSDVSKFLSNTLANKKNEEV